MTEAHGSSVGERRAAASRDAPPLRVFINYRHEDTEETAARLYRTLEARFGAENVFLDGETLGAGAEWLEAIKDHGAGSTAFLALIGRTWLASLKEREQLTPGAPPDYVALELELALGRWPGKVIPVLVGRTTMPDAVNLPRAIKALAGIQALPLRAFSFDEDAASLIQTLEAIPRERDRARFTRATAKPAVAAGQLETSDDGGRPDVIDAGGVAADTTAKPAVPAPDAAHYESVLECMIDQGSVVPILGSGVCGSLPDAAQLAAHLAQQFGLGSRSLDLAEVAQRVRVARGRSFLDRAMRAALTPQPEPNDTHRFLARFPTYLEQLGLAEQYQMIVTTNYDSALEEAFKAEKEPFDLAVFLANGTDAKGTNRGKFLHVPWQGEPELIQDTNKYRKFPIDGNDELERTVIVKVNGAAEGGEGDYRWDGSYVLTEDQYIDYLVTDQIAGVIPHQILNKLTGSNCLFLGYAMHDWSLRVFLKRIWEGRALENKSWAIEREPDALEKDSWGALSVELLASSPRDYANELDARARAWRAGGA
jgi:hypothetical protein